MRLVDGFLEATRHRFAGKAFTLDEERNADVGKKLVGVGGDGVHHFADFLERVGSRPDIMERVTTRVECADYFEQRNSALLAHATQIDPNGWFFAAPVEMQQRVWPTEEFELAASRVGFPELGEGQYEADLFEGIDPNVDLPVGPSTSEDAR